MNSVSQSGLRCVVDGEEKLPPEVGGPVRLCAAIERAALPQLQNAGIAPVTVAVRVTVKSSSRISAVASIGDRALPEQNVGISDRPLNVRAVDMLAQAVAGQLAKVE
jgi:hypothetical protein